MRRTAVTESFVVAKGSFHPIASLSLSLCNYFFAFLSLLINILFEFIKKKKEKKEVEKRLI